MHKYSFFQNFQGWEEFRQRPLPERLPLFYRDGRIYDVLFSQQFDREFREIDDEVERILNFMCNACGEPAE